MIIERNAKIYTIIFLSIVTFLIILAILTYFPYQARRRARAAEIVARVSSGTIVDTRDIYRGPIEKAFIVSEGVNQYSVALLMSNQGFNGPIHLIALYTLEGLLIRFDVIRHQEVHGVGDAVFTPDFRQRIVNFLSSQLGNRDQLDNFSSANLDVITGASWSYRALTSVLVTGSRFVEEEVHHAY